MISLNLPSLDGLDTGDGKQMRRLQSYLLRLEEQLRFALSNIDEENLSTGLLKVIDSKVDSGEIASLIRQSSGEILLLVRKPASAVDTGNGIVINEKGVDISAGGGSQYLRITPDIIEATEIQSPTVSPRYAGAKELTVNPDATAEEMAEGSVYRSLSDALAAVNGKQLEGKLQINCSVGAVMYGDIELSGVCGGEIEINASGAELYGSFSADGCSCRIRIDRLSIISAEGSALRAQVCTYIGLNGCVLSASVSDALEISEGTRLYAEGCTLISAAGSAAFITTAAFGVFVDCIGTGALAVQFASLAAMGTVPDGGCENRGCSLINAEDVVPTGADGEPTMPETMTKSYPMVHSDSYRGGWNWYEDNDIRQGYITSGRIRGCMWFDNNTIRAELGGKTVKQASIGLYAMKGVGRGTAVSVELYGTTVEYADRMSSAPALTTSYGVIGSATPGEVTTITIPTQAASDLINGTINALMVYSSDTELHGEKSYSRNYARFAGETSGTADTIPVLTIVTEGRAADDVTVTVDSEGNATISGAAVTVDSEGNATIDGAVVTTDGNMTIE